MQKSCKLYFPGKGPFWGAILEGAYLRREICVSKSIRLAYSWKEFYRFFLLKISFYRFSYYKLQFTNYNYNFLLCIWGHCFQAQAPGGLYSEGSFNETFFALRVWGAYIWRGLFSEFYGMGRTKDRCMAIYNWLHNALLIINCSPYYVRRPCNWWPII